MIIIDHETDPSLNVKFEAGRLTIGCASATPEQWLAATDRQILATGGKGRLKWWKETRGPLFARAREEGLLD